MKIMIAGGLDEVGQGSKDAKDIQIFGQQLAKEVIRQKHTLVCGNLTAFDGLVIDAACDEVGDNAKAKARVHSYRPVGHEKYTNRGSVFNSELDRWNVIGKVLRYPEPIYQADVIILVSGWEGTHTAANWARLAQKPILPVATFGEAAREIYQRDRAQLPVWFGRQSDLDDFDILNRAIANIDEAQAAEFAKEIISLAERMLLSRYVFVIMSYNPDLNDAARAFKEVCEEYGFNGERMDREVRGGAFEITEAITNAIRDCAFTIVDVTENRPNVYYELGYARALKKPVILTAKKGTDVHFDIKGLKRIEWTGFLDLRDQLRPVVETLAADFGAN